MRGLLGSPEFGVCQPPKRRGCANVAADICLAWFAVPELLARQVFAVRIDHIAPDQFSGLLAIVAGDFWLAAAHHTHPIQSRAKPRANIGRAGFMRREGVISVSLLCSLPQIICLATGTVKSVVISFRLCSPFGFSKRESLLFVFSDKFLVAGYPQVFHAASLSLITVSTSS